MAVSIPLEDVAEFKEVFNFFDADKDGFISGAEFGNIVRSLGYNPTEGELTMWCRTMERAYGGRMDFNGFVKMMANVVIPKTRAPAESARLIEDAFKTFGRLCRGKDDGHISVKDLSYLMTKRGDKLDPASFRQMLRDAPTHRGAVPYDELVAQLVKGS